MTDTTDQGQSQGEDPSPYETCVAKLDRHANQFGGRIISQDEYGAKVYATLSEYFDSDRPEDDIALLFQYARLPVAEMAEDLIEGDRASIDAFDRQLQGLLHYPTAQATLDEQLVSITERLAVGDGEALQDLVSLCRDGWREQPHVFMFQGNVERALQAAADLGAVEALLEAVNPANPDPGPLGGPHLFGGRGRHLAFDLLAELATRLDQTGADAIDALVKLSGFLETAAVAAVRLPVHRLNAGHREVLLQQLEAVSELLGRDPFLTPVHDADRIPHILRSILWLANDAERTF